MGDRTCSVADCDRPPTARGFCQRHYTKWHRQRKRLGLPLGPKPRTLNKGKNKATCSADECDRTAETRGLCGMHYQRLRAGSAKAGPSHREDAATRFWRYVDRRSPDECWPWIGVIQPRGYGIFGMNGKKVLAHRVAYELAIGPIPDGLQIDHVRARGCTRRDCVNPGHLEPVTGQENNLRSTNVSAINAAKTHCPKGHPYDRVYKRKDGLERVCGTCARENLRRFRAKRRSA